RLDAEKVFGGYSNQPKPSGFIAFSPDGKYLAAAANYEIHVRALPDGITAYTIPMPQGAIQSLAYGKDGRLYAGDMNGALAVFAPGKTEPDIVEAMQFPVTALAVSPDGRSL